MSLPPYAPLPPTLPPGYKIQGLEVLYPYFHNTSSIFYLVRGQQTLQEFFPHPKTLESQLPVKVERDSIGQVIGIPEDVYLSRKQMFLYGARIWMELNNHTKDLLRVDEYFEQNNTSYAIREYLPGQPLIDCRPTTQEWKNIAKQILQGLKIIHGSNHSPKGFSSSEIWVSNDIIKLLDFSAMRKIDNEFNPQRDLKRLLRLLKDWAHFEPSKGLSLEQSLESFING